jgi:hypothetical protein
MTTPRITYYVALPFIRHEAEGELTPAEPAECQTARAAIARAEVLARTKGGVVAFSRTGDPQLVEFDPAEVLATVGEKYRS